jgi:hypothetical protein
VSESDVTRAAQAHIHPDGLLTVIVGDREGVGPALAALNLGEAAQHGVA